MTTSIAKDLTVEIFPNCNGNCDFCFEKHINDYIPIKVEKDRNYYIDLCINSIKKNNIISNSMEIWGGEIFYNDSPSYVKKMIELFRTINPREITISSNLFANIEENELFQYLYHKYGTKHLAFCTSPDPIGRFKNPKQKKKFLENIKYLHTILPYIEFVMVINDEILHEEYDLEFIKEIFDNPKNIMMINFDYTGFKRKDTIENFVPLMLRFWERYPMNRDLKRLFTPRKAQFCECHNKNAIFLSYRNNFQFDNTILCIKNIHNAKTFMIEKIERIWHCQSCEFHNLCGDICPTELERSGILRENSDCPYKAFLNHFRDKLPTVTPESLNNFNKNPHLE